MRGGPAPLGHETGHNQGRWGDAATAQVPAMGWPIMAFTLLGRSSMAHLGECSQAQERGGEAGGKGAHRST